MSAGRGDGERPVPDRSSLRESYLDAGFGARLEPGRKAALVAIDVVNAYVLPESPLCVHRPQVLDNIRRLLAAARQAGMPVLFTEVLYQPGGIDGGVFYRKVPALRMFERGSRWGEWPEGVELQQGEIRVVKQYASAFFGTSLASSLRAADVDTVFLCGYSTSGCVRASAVDAIQLGFLPFVVGDASGDRDDSIQQANLFDLQAKYAEVVDTEQALGWMGG